MPKKVKEFISRYNLSITVLIFSMVFLVAGFVCPPLGIIDNSVLVALGELFGFTAAICGLDTYRSTKGIEDFYLETKKLKDSEADE